MKMHPEGEALSQSKEEREAPPMRPLDSPDDRFSFNEEEDASVDADVEAQELAFQQKISELRGLLEALEFAMTQHHGYALQPAQVVTLLEAWLAMSQDHANLVEELMGCSNAYGRLMDEHTVLQQKQDKLWTPGLS